MRYTIPDIADIELERFKKDSNRTQAYTQARNLLRASGIFNFLRVFSRPKSPDGGANVYRSAYSAAFQEGYNSALEDMEYMEEKYLAVLPSTQGVKADFGARKLLQERGFVTEGVENGKEK